MPRESVLTLAIASLNTDYNARSVTQCCLFDEYYNIKTDSCNIIFLLITLYSITINVPLISILLVHHGMKAHKKCFRLI